MARILIVDDDEDFLRLLSEYLASVGLEHDVAANAQQACTYLQRFRYDVVISDFNMPGETGLDLFRHVSSVYPETRFALMTGHDLKIKRKSLKAGVHAFIQKPFYFDALRQTIMNLTRPLQSEDQKAVAGSDRLEPCLGPTLKIAFCGNDDGEFLILRRVLEQIGYGDSIWTCRCNAKALLDTLCAKDGNLPDVILLDILMLFRGGLENMEKMKHNSRLRNVPLLLAAGAPEYARAVLQKYPHLEIDGILTKPVTFESLASLLKPYRKSF